MPVISGNTEELSVSVKSLKEKKGGRSAFYMNRKEKLNKTLAF
ncbi:hypothetical protein HMPREF0542_10376 [Ligilactobacillus ruminis ATCC 25644]|uniref:Uncharacterized protein n=1 Tax=Ligilactobacillus ruminis ATCC 25644 TaxID=525362 RepID=E7FN99_9LACO|nr:hypothetical protein HMPREF0542_10376 [Ligilactobacillus ruminis ATCC 25644]